MAASQIGRAPERIRAVAQEGSGKWAQFPDLIKEMEIDIRRNLHPPFSKKVANDLSGVISLVMYHIVEDLENAPATMTRPVTGPLELQSLQEDGEKILDIIGRYIALAEHYENEQVVRHRLKRRTDEVSREVDEVSDKAGVLKGRIIKYLQEIYKCISGTGI